MSKRRAKRRERTSAFSGEKSSSGGWLSLPEGVEEWYPKETGSFVLDILPYEVKTNHHSRDGVTAGSVAPEREFRVHYDVGPEKKSIVCPRSIGKKCAICDEADRLYQEDYEGNKALIQQLNGQRQMMMNADLIEGNSRKRIVFVWSIGKFFLPLQEKISVRPEFKFFWDVEDGYTLKIHVKEEIFNRKKFLQAVDFDFKSRPDMDEDEVLDSTVCLDKVLNVLPPEQVAAMFNGDVLDEPDDEPQEQDAEEPEADAPDEDEKPESEEDDFTDDDDQEWV